MQAGAWPMCRPRDAQFLAFPARLPGDGLGTRAARDPARSAASQQLIIDMLIHMKRHPSRAGRVMEMPRFGIRG